MIGHTVSFGLRPSTGPATVSNIPTPVDPKLSASLNKLDAVHAEDARTAAHLAEHPPVKKRNILGRLWHDYGYVGVGTYLSIYVGTLGMLYVAVRSGALGADTVLNIVTKLGLESHFPSDISSKKGDFLIAWVATKLTEPVRASLTMAVTPRLARWVGMAPPKAETVAMLKQAVKKH